MGFFIYSLQLLKCCMGVYLRRFKTLMAEQFLYTFYPRTMIEHSGCKSVPKHMRRTFLQR